MGFRFWRKKPSVSSSLKESHQEVSQQQKQVAKPPTLEESRKLLEEQQKIRINQLEKNQRIHFLESRIRYLEDIKKHPWSYVENFGSWSGVKPNSKIVSKGKTLFSKLFGWVPFIGSMASSVVTARHITREDATIISFKKPVKESDKKNYKRLGIKYVDPKSKEGKQYKNRFKEIEEIIQQEIKKRKEELNKLKKV